MCSLPGAPGPGRASADAVWTGSEVLFIGGTGNGNIDGVAYDGRAPNAYLAKFAIGLKQGQRVAASGVSPA